MIGVPRRLLPERRLWQLRARVVRIFEEEDLTYLEANPERRYTFHLPKGRRWRIEHLRSCPACQSAGYVMAAYDAATGKAVPIP